LDERGKLGSMSDSGTAVSVPAADSADPACDVAHGKAPLPASTRTLVAVFVSPVARFLLSYARDAGYRPVLVDPDAGLLADRHSADHHGADHHGADHHGADQHGAHQHGAHQHGADQHGAEHHGPGPEALDGLAALDGLTTVTALAGLADEATDVVVTDHHRPELGPVLRDALASPARWVGILGNPRHPAPHIPALAALGVPDEQIARVHRPIGLNIGSRTPAEIALATMAGLIADRNGRPGGFEF
jgi:xanthine/CO dehydrogenase XdhC/CoxF family maturation factor